MKKCAVVCFALLMLLLCGCGGSTAATATATPAATPAFTPSEILEGGDRTALIPEFPLNELPLYACTKVLSSSLTRSVVQGDSYSFGVDYLTSASKDDALAFYLGIMTDAAERDEYADTYEGTLYGRRAGLFVYPDEEDGQVRLSISLEAKLGTYTEHPYMKDYPTDVPALVSDKLTLNTEEYRLNCPEYGGRKYRIAYSTTLTAEEAKALCEETYGDFDRFSANIMENGSLHVFFVQGNNDWSINSSQFETSSGTYRFLDITCFIDAELQ